MGAYPLNALLNRNDPLVKNPEISLENFVKYLYHSAAFISKISGPISNIILKTYANQTKVHQLPLEKKEPNAFRVKPGAMFKLRCCD